MRLKHGVMGHEMSRPIQFAVAIAIACAVGFIFGVLFEDYHGKKQIRDTISQHDSVSELFIWYEMATIDSLVLEDLDNVKSMEELNDLQVKWRRNGASHVNLFREKAEQIRKSGGNVAALQQLEIGINELGQKYGFQAP